MILASVLGPIEDLLRGVLDWLHSTIGLPWAWAIVALTIIVRMLLVPLTVRQIHSMQRLQAHAPQMKEIQRKFKGDRQRMNEEMMRFYKENRINPASSCLPLLAQAPIFFALFFVLRNFADERPSGSLSWLGIVPDVAQNAGEHWSGYLLLAVYVISQMASTWLMPMADNRQRILLLLLPLAFLFFVINFPAGLVLYWMTTNLWTVGQGLVTRGLRVKTQAATPPKRSSRTPPREQVVSADGDRAAAGGPAKTGPSPPPRRVKRKKKAKR